MAVTTTWKVLDMKHNPNDGGVLEVKWELRATADTGETAVEGGELKIDSYDASSPNFIPFANLTEETVLGWVWDDLGDKKAEIESDRTAKVDAQIAKKANEATGLPWSN